MRKIGVIFLLITVLSIFSCSTQKKVSFYKKQIRKQQNNIETDAKKKLNSSFLEGSNFKLKEKRYSKIESMLKEADIDKIQNYYLEKKLTIKEVVAYYLQKIEKYKDLNAVISLNDNALKIASNQDKNLKQIKDKALFGIPVLIKDNIAVKNLFNTAGTKALEKLIPEDDAFLIAKLKEENAIILGKANLSEWANFMSSNSSNGYSALGGQTKNPYGDFDVGGSSSGSAVAVAANLVPVALGTETCGSLIYPASQNSVVTLKPTTGLISRDGIIPISYTQDTAGPIAKNVEDAAILFESMVGVDKNDRKTEIARGFNPKYPDEYLDKSYLENKRIGLVVNEKIEKWYRKEDKKIIKRIVNDLESINAEVVEVKLDERIFNINMRKVYYHEFDNGVNKYLEKEKYEKFSNLKDIIEFNKKNKETRAYYGQDLLINAIKKNISENENEKNVLQNLNNSKKPLDKIMEENNLDFVMTLSNYLSAVYAPAGYPAINIPAGYRKNNEPIGVTFIAKALEDRKLLKAGYSFQQHTNYRKPPQK